MANCVRLVECGQRIPGKPETWLWRPCSQPATQTRQVTALLTLEDSFAVPDLRYGVALCHAHARELDEG